MDADKKQIFDKDGIAPGEVTTPLGAGTKFSDAVHHSSKALRKAQKNIIIAMAALLFLAVGIGVVGITANQRMALAAVTLREGLLDMRFKAQQLNASVLRIYVAMRDLALCEPDEELRMARIESVIEAEKVHLNLHYAGLTSAKAAAWHDSVMFRKLLNSVRETLSDWEPIRDKNIFLAKNGYMEECRTSIRSTEADAVARINTSTTALVEAVIAEGARASIEAESDAADLHLFLSVGTVVVLLMGIFITAYEIISTNKTMRLVDNTQEELFKTLAVLVAKDEALQKSLDELDREIAAGNEMKERFINSLDAAEDVIFEANMESGSFFASNKWQDVVNRPVPSSFSKEDVLCGVPKRDRENLMSIVRSRHGHFEMDFRLVDADNRLRWMHIKCRWMDESQGTPYRLIGSLSNITQGKALEREMAYLAKHDTLTNLPNRTSFTERLGVAIQKGPKAERLAVLFLDLDNFKEINDTHGHAFGDEILRVLAQRFKSIRRKGVQFARFGGDEFLCMVSGIGETESVYKLAEEIRYLISQPLVVNAIESSIASSIGVVTFPEDGEDVESLLKNVDSAMYESKKSGGNKVSFYDKAISEMLVRKIKITNILRSAIAEKVIHLEYQPQFNVKAQKTASVEALMRLYDEELGSIPPSEFIPIAEATQQIIPLGYWALHEAIECEKRLCAEGIELDNIAVNISEIQLRDPDFITNVRKIIKAHDYDPQRLHFEITESVFLSDMDNKIKMFEELKSIGIKIELDDFGTGYSSLNYLRRIPLDVIKIDKCFVDEIGRDMQQEALLELIINLCKINNTHSIAEGVESREQVDFLVSRGTSVLQGHYYSKSLKEDRLVEELRRLNKLPNTPQV